MGEEEEFGWEEGAEGVELGGGAGVDVGDCGRGGEEVGEGGEGFVGGLLLACLLGVAAAEGLKEVLDEGVGVLVAGAAVREGMN